MKRLLFVALALALGLGFASAQNITKSLQGSQDPRGPVGIDTSNSVYFQNHINSFGNTTGFPTVINCGTGPLITAGSTDNAGQIQPQGTAGCTVKFGSPFNAAPSCIVMPNGLFSGQTTGTSTTVIAATTSFSITPTQSGVNYNYICMGNQ